MKNEEAPPKTHSETAAKDKIPVHEKLVYGLGGPAQFLAGAVGERMSQKVLTLQLGINPALISLSMMIFRFFDSFIDPLMGWISDNFRSKWGRRRPFMVVGIVLAGLTLPFFYRFDSTWGTGGIMTWFIGIGLVMAVFTTIFNVPFQSLKFEMTPDYHERTSVNAYASLVARGLTFVVPWTWWLTQQPLFTDLLPDGQPDTLQGVRNVSLIFAGLMILLGILPALICKERYYKKAIKTKKEPILKSLKLTLKNRTFLLILMTILFMQIEGITDGLAMYLNVYYVWGGDRSGASWVAGMSGTLASVAGISSIPVWAYLAKRVGKHQCLYAVFFLDFLIAAMVWVVYNPELPWLVIFNGVFDGILVAGMWTVIPSMMADVLDKDEWETGERREGIYAASMGWFNKFADTLFFGLSGPLLHFIGFRIAKEANQAEGVFTWIKISMSTVPAICAICMVVCISLYPLSEEKVREIRDKLEARRGAINP